MSRLPQAGFFFAVLLLSWLATAPAAFAAEPEFTLVIRDHKFQPAELKIPANTKVRLIVDNQDATAEEFESKDLKREKVIPPKSKGTVLIGPLKPGRYTFVGEFHESTAKGVIIVE
ncbi:MAG TPA: cupredoxin domain-containing protein [Casimicrobiaceae bacterium]|nr:cupredoxin domain-containing protein [Casimicrobiaceae bacterium]